MKKWFLLTLLLGLPLAAEPISLVLKEAPTAEVLSYLAEETQQNMVINHDISGTTTLRLKESNFSQILKSIAKINQLSLTQEQGIFYLSHKPEHSSETTPVAITHTETVLESKPKLLTKTIKLHYAKASEAGYLHFDDRSNSLIIKDSPASIKNITALIQQLDQPTEQIAIEARIVTIGSENLKELGVRWGVLSGDTNHHRLGGKLEGNGIASTQNLNVNFPVSGGASAVLQIASINSRVLDLELSALEQENNVEIIASPRLLTTNKKLASIKQGTEIPYAIYDRKSETYDVEFKEAVLGLEVTPHLSKDNQILLDLVVTQNSQGQSAVASSNGTNAPPIDKQELNTQVFAKHGETIVLGGIFQHLATKDADRVPVLGSIPFIKHLFSYQKDQITKRELVIFVTPYIVKSGDMAVKFPNSTSKPALANKPHIK